MWIETSGRPTGFGGRKIAWVRLFLLSFLFAYGLYTLGLLLSVEYRGAAPAPLPRPWPAHLERP